MRVSRLPDFVEPFDTAVRYSANSKVDLLRLATALRALTGSRAATIAAAMVSARVMFPPLIHRIPAWIFVKRGGAELTFWRRVFFHERFGQKLSRAILDSAATWAVNGTDRESITSVGGFSQREINFIGNLLSLTHDNKYGEVAA